MCDSDIGFITWSDHAPIIVTMLTSCPAVNHKLWRLNPLLLADPSSTEKLTVAHYQFFATNATTDVDIFTVCCTYKAYMRDELVKLASQTNKKRRAQIDTLLTDIRDKEKLNKINPTPGVSSALIADRLALRNLLLRRFKSPWLGVKPTTTTFIINLGLLWPTSLNPTRPIIR